MQFVSTVWQSSLWFMASDFLYNFCKHVSVEFQRRVRKRFCCCAVHMMFLALLLGLSGAASIRLPNLWCFQIVLSKCIKFHSWETNPLKISVAVGLLKTLRLRVGSTYGTSASLCQIRCASESSQSQVGTQTLHVTLPIFLTFQDQPLSRTLRYVRNQEASYR